MSGLTLTSRERQILKRQLVETLDARVLRRTLAVSEFDQGRPVQEIAKMLGVTRQSIYNWIAAYRETRSPGALHDRPGRGRQRSLDEDEERLLDTFLESSPQEFGYPHANWTVALLGEMLEWVIGERRSEDTLRRAIGRLDYVWKRPRYDLLPDPDKEKKTSNSPANPGFAPAKRRVGPGRDRPVAVSSATCRLVEARRGRPSLVERSQCPAGDLRGHESQDRNAVVRASGQRAELRFSSISGSRSFALSRRACGVALG
jgi:transposase